jgi:hypothetical protein
MAGRPSVRSNSAALERNYNYVFVIFLCDAIIFIYLFYASVTASCATVVKLFGSLGVSRQRTNTCYIHELKRVE